VIFAEPQRSAYAGAKNSGTPCAALGNGGDNVGPVRIKIANMNALSQLCSGIRRLPRTGRGAPHSLRTVMQEAIQQYVRVGENRDASLDRASIWKSKSVQQEIKYVEETKLDRALRHLFVLTSLSDSRVGALGRQPGA